MPHGRYWHDSILAPDGKIYTMGGSVFKVIEGFKAIKSKSVLGGWMFDNIRDGYYSNLIYDPNTDQWHYGRAVPCNRLPTGTYYRFHHKKTDVWNSLLIDYNSEKKGQTYYYEYDLANRRYNKDKRIYIEPSTFENSDYEIYYSTQSRIGSGVALALGLNNCIYWLGGKGRKFGDGENVVIPFDLKTQDWPNFKGVEKEIEYLQSIFPQLNERRYGHRAITFPDGRMYVLGGLMMARGQMVPSKTIECYIPSQNQWVYKKEMSSPRIAFAAVLGSDNKIYVFGGMEHDIDMKDSLIAQTVDVYNPNTDEWERKRNMPEPRTYHAAVLGNDSRIYIIGGSKIKNSPQKSVFIYDPATDSWSTGPDMNVHRSVLSAVATPNGKIYAIGGTDVGAYPSNHNNLFSLSTETGTYSGKVQDTVEVLDLKELHEKTKK